VLSDNLARVRARIQQACQRCGRDPASVTLVCVTKGMPVEMIREALSLGVTDLGENRVQEAHEKQLALYGVGEGSRVKGEGRDPTLHPPPSTLYPLRWHLIGHLQRNKAKDAVEWFSVIHSVDSAALAEELERQAAKEALGFRLEAEGKSLKPQASSLKLLEVFIQVNVSGEATKFGCTPAEAPSLAQAIGRLPHLRLIGLMAMAPFVEHPEQARQYFRHLRLLREELLHSSLITHHSSLLLSMGMSSDFEVAIEEGTDFVRIGSAIFGHR